MWFLRILLLFNIVLFGRSDLLAMEFPYMSCFQIASDQSGIELDLLMAVAAVESNWDADARSSANAHGVMQIRWPLTARHLGAGRVAELYNPCLNISMGAAYLKELSDRYQGDQRFMLAAYNYGPSRIKTEGDIPAAVLVYADRVMQQRKKIVQTMNRQIPQTLQRAGVIEVNRFDSAARARRYLESLGNQVPGARLTIRRSATGESVIYLDTANLGTQTRYRLASLLPDLKG